MPITGNIQSTPNCTTSNTVTVSQQPLQIQPKPMVTIFQQTTAAAVNNQSRLINTGQFTIQPSNHYLTQPQRSNSINLTHQHPNQNITPIPAQINPNNGAITLTLAPIAAKPPSMQTTPAGQNIHDNNTNNNNNAVFSSPSTNFQPIQMRPTNSSGCLNKSNNTIVQNVNLNSNLNNTNTNTINSNNNTNTLHFNVNSNNNNNNNATGSYANNYYRDWILEAIDKLRERKARPDADRISTLMKRYHNVPLEDTVMCLSKLADTGAVVCVDYKGNISYRNPYKWRKNSANGGGIINPPSVTNRLLEAFKYLDKTHQDNGGNMNQTGTSQKVGYSIAEIEQAIAATSTTGSIESQFSSKSQLRHCIDREATYGKLMRRPDCTYIIDENGEKKVRKAAAIQAKKTQITHKPILNKSIAAAPIINNGNINTVNNNAMNMTNNNNNNNINNNGINTAPNIASTPHMGNTNAAHIINIPTVSANNSFATFSVQPIQQYHPHHQQQISSLIQPPYSSVTFAPVSNSTMPNPILPKQAVTIATNNNPLHTTSTVNLSTNSAVNGQNQFAFVKYEPTVQSNEISNNMSTTINNNINNINNNINNINNNNNNNNIASNSNPVNVTFIPSTPHSAGATNFQLSAISNENIISNTSALQISNQPRYTTFNPTANNNNNSTLSTNSACTNNNNNNINNNAVASFDNNNYINKVTTSPNSYIQSPSSQTNSICNNNNNLNNSSTSISSTAILTNNNNLNTKSNRRGRPPGSKNKRQDMLDNSNYNNPTIPPSPSHTSSASVPLPPPLSSSSTSQIVNGTTNMVNTNAHQQHLPIPTKRLKLENETGAPSNSADSSSSVFSVSNSDQTVPATGSVIDLCSECKMSQTEFEKFLFCKDCPIKVHPSCLHYWPELTERARQSLWQCSACKTCSICNDKSSKESVYICDGCDKGFHANCHDPKIKEPISRNAAWICNNCYKEGFRIRLENGSGVDSKTKKDAADERLGNGATMTNHNNNNGNSGSNNNCGNSNSYISNCNQNKCNVKVEEKYITDNGKENQQQHHQHHNGSSKVEIQTPKPPESPAPTTSGNRSDDVTQWSVDDVCTWLIEEGFSCQANSFREQEIDGACLLLMKRIDVLTELNIKLGPAVKIYEKIKRIQNDGSLFRVDDCCF